MTRSTSVSLSGEPCKLCTARTQWCKLLGQEVRTRVRCATFMRKIQIVYSYIYRDRRQDVAPEMEGN